MRCAAGRESDELMAQARATDTQVAAGAPGVPSVVIPAHNEADNLESTVAGLIAALKAAQITHEILIVDDNSTDNSRALLAELSARYPKLLSIDNAPPNGFGFAVRAGLDTLRRNAVAIVMADGSDAPPTLCHAIRRSPRVRLRIRFAVHRGGKVIDYPTHKLVFNRLANLFIRVLFCQRFNDFTNAFKLYRREVIAGLQPLL